MLAETIAAKLPFILLRVTRLFCLIEVIWGGEEIRVCDESFFCRFDLFFGGVAVWGTVASSVIIFSSITSGLALFRGVETVVAALRFRDLHWVSVVIGVGIGAKVDDTTEKADLRLGRCGLIGEKGLQVHEVIRLWNFFKGQNRCSYLIFGLSARSTEPTLSGLTLGMRSMSPEYLKANSVSKSA